MSANMPEFTAHDLIGLAPRWDELIAADIVRAIEKDSVPDMRFALAIKGYREMHEILTAETKGKSGIAAFGRWHWLFDVMRKSDRACQPQRSEARSSRAVNGWKPPVRCGSSSLKLFGSTVSTRRPPRMPTVGAVVPQTGELSWLTSSSSRAGDYRSCGAISQSHASPNGRSLTRPVSRMQNRRRSRVVVTPSKQLFYCYSAGIGGDLISLWGHIEMFARKIRPPNC
jgi:hypothetical protein